MDLPFQLIFSIILIAAFLYAAIVGIRFFMESQQKIQIQQFYADLKSDVNVAWNSAGKTQTYSFTLPSAVKKVCLVDLKSTNAFSNVGAECTEFFTSYKELAKAAGSNIFVCPPIAAWKVGAQVHYKINCEGNDCIQFSKQLYCFDVKDGKVSIHIEKKFGTPNVILS